MQGAPRDALGGLPVSFPRDGRLHRLCNALAVWPDPPNMGVCDSIRPGG